MQNKKTRINAIDVARYLLYRSNLDGDFISPLKMQKIVYYTYVWTLINNKKHLFDEKIEAWPNGPVVPSLYRQLKKYGSKPIDEEFLGKNPENIPKKFTKQVKETIDRVYEKYMTKTAFELVLLTHNEKPWIQARKGLSPNQISKNIISDKIILSYYSK